MLDRVAALIAVAGATARRRLQEATEHPERGDASITTIIIWVAAISGAIAIAGTIAALIAEYNNKLGNI